MSRRRKSRTHVPKQEDPVKMPPRSFIVKSGDVGHLVSNLIKDLRKVMSPNTADKLRERKTNKIRDYIALAGPLHVSHLIMLNRSATGLNLRLSTIPRGPTATFKVIKYTLMKDIAHTLKSPKSFSMTSCLHPPLLVMNQFPMHLNQYKILSATLLALFPPILVTDPNLKTSSIRRVVLFNYVPDSDSIEVRHYVIDVKPIGVSKGVRHILGGAKNALSVPNLAEFSDIAEFITRETLANESDVEDSIQENQVNAQKQQRVIKLTELGPRLDLSLTKIQTGLCTGEVLYHRYVTKSDSEVALQRDKINQRDKIRAERKAQQDANVARKQAAAALKKNSPLDDKFMVDEQQDDADDDFDLDADDVECASSDDCSDKEEDEEQKEVMARQRKKRRY